MLNIYSYVNKLSASINNKHIYYCRKKYLIYICSVNETNAMRAIPQCCKTELFFIRKTSKRESV